MLAKIRQFSLRSYVALQTLAADQIEAQSQKQGFERHLPKVSLGLGIAIGTALEAGAAVAASTCGSGGSQTSLNTLTTFISDASDFLIGLGAAGALLMFAVGALFIIFGHKPDHVSRGMKTLKNAVIGLCVLAGGIFIKVVVVDFVLGAIGSGNSTSSNCLQNGNSNLAGSN